MLINQKFYSVETQNVGEPVLARFNNENYRRPMNIRIIGDILLS